MRLSVCFNTIHAITMTIGFNFQQGHYGVCHCVYFCVKCAHYCTVIQYCLYSRH